MNWSSLYELTWFQYFSYSRICVYYILHIGISAICIFNSNLSVECTVQLPSKRVTTIPHDVISSKILFRARMVDKISKTRTIFSVPLGTSRKYNPPLLLVISRLIQAYAMFWSGTNLGKFVWTNLQNSSTSNEVSRRKSQSKRLLVERFVAVIPICVITLLAIANRCHQYKSVLHYTCLVWTERMDFD